MNKSKRQELKEMLVKAEAPDVDPRSESRERGSLESSMVSVVVPVHNEVECLPRLHRELSRAMNGLGVAFEILYVDDGSTDGSSAVLEEIAEREPAVTVVRLRRQFGKSAALDAGFRRVRGARVVTLDGDLQNDPTDIPRLLEALKDDVGVVIGWRRERSLTPFGRLSHDLFNTACHLSTGQRLHDYDCGLKAMRREVVGEIELYGELHRYLAVLADWRGFRLAEVPVNHHARQYGRSKFGPQRIVKTFFDYMTVGMLTRFNTSPLHVFGLLGVGLTSIGLGVNSYLATIWFFGAGIGSRPLLFFGILLIIIGLQTMFFGLLAELIVHARREENDYAIDRVLSHGSSGTSGTSGSHSGSEMSLHG